MFKYLSQIDHHWLLAINHLANSSKFWQDIFKFLGIYLIYLIPVILVVLWFWEAKSKKVALAATLAGLFSWLLLAKIIALLVRRPRPFESGGVRELIFTRPDFSFPSDHAAFLFAVGLTFLLSGYKKLSYFVFVIAILVSIGRIGIGIHYPGDILAGAILGLAVAWVVWLLERPLNFVYNFLILVAKKVRLA